MTTYYLPPGVDPKLLPPLVDGDVVEVHPAAGLPATLAPWGTVTVRAAAEPSPGAVILGAKP